MAIETAISLVLMDARPLPCLRFLLLVEKMRGVFFDFLYLRHLLVFDSAAVLEPLARRRHVRLPDRLRTYGDSRRQQLFQVSALAGRADRGLRSQDQLLKFLAPAPALVIVDWHLYCEYLIR